MTTKKKDEKTITKRHPDKNQNQKTKTQVKID